MLAIVGNLKTNKQNKTPNKPTKNQTQKHLEETLINNNYMLVLQQI